MSMNAVVAFDASKFAVGIANMAKGATSRVGFLKMGKDGVWCYGADETEVGEATVLVDPMGFVQGWQCWADTDLPGVSSELLGELVVPMFDELPPRPPKVPENGRPWGELRGLSALLGDLKLTYSTTSVGGCKAVAALAEAIAVQYRKAPTKIIAEVSLTCDSYKHKNKTYGKIFVPVFEVVGWHAKLPEAATEPVKLAPPAKKAAAKKRA
jgi:hypothetical protein